jgi:hypothetical protein
MRAGKITLDDIAACLLRHLREQRPLVLVAPHDRGDDHLVRIIGLQPADAAEVCHGGALGGLLDVLEADERRRFLADRVEPRGHLVGREQPDGLRRRAGPARLERAGDHLVVVGDDGRGQEERVLAFDTAKRDGQVAFRLRRGSARGLQHGVDGDSAR